MVKKYIVRLSDQERQHLEEIVKRLKGSSQKVRRANILLKANVDGANWNDAKIAEALSCRTRTVENLRKRFVLEGFDSVLNRKKRETPPIAKKLDGKQEAEIIALRLGPAPSGFANWSLRLLAERVVELGIVESISHETLRRTLKRGGMTPRKIQYWVIPPHVDAEFTAAMEDVLDVYAQPYDEICMDEQPVQLTRETRTPIAATKEHPRRVDYEYERAGTACIFMFTEPLSGWRNVTARPHRTKVDWALEMEELLRTRYAKARKVIVVCDNLNTHTRGAFYEAFEPEKARELVKRVEFHYTPKHGSWLNIAENELSSMTRQCLSGRRIESIEMLRKETAAWASASNKKQRGVDWQFTIDNARNKLKSLYPKIKM
ncbi:IS630 family transposase [uncultured Desulfuromonas sp.]|uniref:IS630 family transposase n=1 Tax=uncultured Desulfuromonas sp. TaxID=181013 RepID=UPI00374CAF5B